MASFVKIYIDMRYFKWRYIGSNRLIVYCKITEAVPRTYVLTDPGIIYKSTPVFFVCVLDYFRY